MNSTKARRSTSKTTCGPLWRSRTARYNAAQFDQRGTSAVLFFHQKDSHTQSDDINNVRIVDVTTGAVRGMSVRHAAFVREVAFSPDGRHIATASFDSTARVWETATGG